jgi:hypothetical protein
LENATTGFSNELPDTPFQSQDPTLFSKAPKDNAAKPLSFIPTLSHIPHWPIPAPFVTRPSTTRIAPRPSVSSVEDSTGPF